MAMATAEGHAFSIIVAHASLGLLQARCGDAGAAIATLEQGLVRGRVADTPILFPLVAGPLGWAYAVAGREDEALTMLEDAIARTEAMELVANHAQRLVWCADAHRRAGRLETARRAAVLALETARRTGERGHEAHALRLLGDVAAAGAAEDGEASEHYRAALALAERLGMRPLAGAVASCLPSPR
jgi:tetratricopeptide (TPR) repeat protein